MAQGPYGYTLGIHGEDISVEGITIRGSSHWTIVPRDSRHVTIRNVKLCNSRVQNDDGINPCNSQDVLITDCFIRSDDDCVAMKGLSLDGANNNVERITVENSILWCDRARIFLLGHESRAASMRQITLRNLDIIHFTMTAFLLEPGEDMRLEEVAVENVRVHGEGQGELIRLKPVVNQYMHKKVPGFINNVRFKNLELTGQVGPYRIQISGADAEHAVKGVTFEDVSILGARLKRDSPQVMLGPHIDAIQFPAQRLKVSLLPRQPEVHSTKDVPVGGPAEAAPERLCPATTRHPREPTMPFASPLLKCSGTLFVLLTGLAAFGADREARDTGLDDQLRQELRLPLGVPLRLVTVTTSKDQKYTVEEAKKHAPDIVRFEACHVGQQRLLFKITFARVPVFQNSGLILYADLDGDPATGRQDSKDHRGVDLMVSVSGTTLSVSHPNATLTAKNAYVAGARVVGSALYLTVDAPLKIADGKVRLDVRLLAEKRGGRSDSTPRETVWLPHAADRDVPKVANKGTPDVRPLSDYRYHDDLVKLERLKDKGLTREQVTPAKPTAFGRSRPPGALCNRSPQTRPTGLRRGARVSVGLLEEAGVARSQAAVRFGLPLAQGSLFDLDQLRLLSPNGEEVPAQFTATSFWPDDSLKWVLVDFTAPLTAKQKLDCQIEFGSDVKRAASKSPLEVDDASGVVTVVTGPLKVEIDKQRFNLLAQRVVRRRKRRPVRCGAPGRRVRPGRCAAGRRARQAVHRRGPSPRKRQDRGAGSSQSRRACRWGLCSGGRSDVHALPRAARVPRRLSASGRDLYAHQ